MTGPEPILEMVAMNGEDGVTVRELVIAEGRKPTARARESMLARIHPLVKSGKLECVMGRRADVAGRPCAVPVYRPVKAS